MGTNASNISLESLRMTGATSANPIAINGAGSNNLININGVAMDAAYLGTNTLVQLNGVGTGCAIRNVTGYNNSSPTSAGNVSSAHPCILQNIATDTAFQGAQMQEFNAAGVPPVAALPATTAVGVNVANVYGNWARGERGFIMAQLTASGMAAGQALVVGAPAGMVIPGGTGWSSYWIIPGGPAAQLITIIIDHKKRLVT